VGSAIDALINHSVDLGPKPAGVDPRRTRSRLGDRRTRHEPVRPKRPKLRNGRAIPRHDERSAPLYLTKDGRGIIPQFTLSDRSRHTMACSICSTM
jgi:hypothetical protein